MVEQNFQPQVGDTTFGPHQHPYISRSDNPAQAINIGGISYIPLGSTIASNGSIPFIVQSGTGTGFVPSYTTVIPTFIPSSGQYAAQPTPKLY